MRSIEELSVPTVVTISRKRHKTAKVGRRNNKMETSFLARRLSMLVLMLCALTGFSVSAMGSMALRQGVARSATAQYSNQNYRMLGAVIRAFEIVDDSQEVLFEKYLLGCPNSEAERESFLRTPEFNNAVVAVFRAAEMSESLALRTRIASILQYMNANHGRFPADKLGRLTFNQDYLKGLMALGSVIESEFSKIIPKEHVSGFKKVMRSHVYPVSRTWAQYLSSQISTKAIVTSLIIAAVVAGGGYLAWKQLGLGEKINEWLKRFKKVEALVDDVNSASPQTRVGQLAQTALTAQSTWQRVSSTVGWAATGFGLFGSAAPVQAAESVSSKPDAPVTVQQSTVLQAGRSASGSDASSTSVERSPESASTATVTASASAQDVSGFTGDLLEIVGVRSPQPKSGFNRIDFAPDGTPVSDGILPSGSSLTQAAKPEQPGLFSYIGRALWGASQDTLVAESAV